MLRLKFAQLIAYSLTQTGLTPAAAQPSKPAEWVAHHISVAAENPRTPYVMAEIRNGPAPKDLRHALIESRTILPALTLRGERQWVRAEDWPLMMAATQRHLKRSFNVEWIQWQIEQAQLETLAQDVLKVLNDHPSGLEPDSLAEALPSLSNHILTRTTRGGRTLATTALELALRWLMATGRVLRFESPRRYVGLAVWLPELASADLPPEATAQTEIVRRYVARYGPVTEPDIDFWTGFGKGERARAMGQLFREVTQVMVEGIPGTLLALKSQTEALQATPAEMPAGLHLLPPHDPYLLAYKASRVRFTPNQRAQNQLFKGQGLTASAILYQGQIVGIWDSPCLHAEPGSESEKAQPISWTLFNPDALTPELETALNTNTE
jgi:hypothetical protein